MHKTNRLISYRSKDIIIVALAVAAVAIILVAWLTMHHGADAEQKAAEQAQRDRSAWCDTLSNRQSDIPALYPMDKEIQRFVDKWGLAGLSLAVVRNDSLLYAKGYGYADREHATPMDAGTTMRIASVSKLVTAAAIMRLRDQGKLRLDDRVFGPGGILADPRLDTLIRDRRMTEITVDHLLQHAGGFSRRAGDPMFSTPDVMTAAHLTEAPDADRLIETQIGKRLATKPGTTRRYSNYGYLVLSKVIERLSGKSYWDFVTDEVLEPIGAATHFDAAGNYRHERHPGEAAYYGPDTVKIREYNNSGRMVDRVYGGNDVHGLMGAGGWTASAPALARFVAAIDGDTGVADVITPESVSIMTARDPEEKVNLARGWAGIGKNGDWVRTGTLSSTHALIVRFAAGDTWVLLTNQGNYKGYGFSDQLDRLLDRIRAQYLDTMPRRNLW